MKKHYSEIPDPPVHRDARSAFMTTEQWIVICFLILVIGIIFGAIAAKAQTPETHDAMPVDVSTQNGSSNYPNTDYPDKTLTPGVTRTVDLKTLCTPGSTKDARHVTQSMKDQVFTRYGLDKGKFKPGDYEIDHFISLENGGANDVMNLWPEHYCPIGNDPMKTKCWGAREKDKVETQLHRWLCQNKITLHDDQTILQNDWIACYLLMSQGKVCKP